ncbi:uncharacterized protein LOC114446263 [Parambassis ranga]|uniref:Uncharacterized protein LOC114446263 n=1 Tax=Parambassis ranga TaxID=210632 RepID=A0A6P7JLB2_9TELE|nr:uncharacterized protein LOC114446263 [Parambassis ranga]
MENANTFIHTNFILEIYQDHQQYTNMMTNGLLLLVCCTELLCVLLPSVISTNDMETTASTNVSQTSAMLITIPTSPHTQVPTGTQHTTTTTTATITTTPNGILNRKDWLTVLMVTGGLIIACAILLTSTLLLTWKVCHLNRRIKALSSNDNLISSSGYWTGTEKKNKSKTKKEEEEAEEVKETTVLMSDLNPTQEEPNNGTIKDEGEKVKKEGEEKEVGDTAKKEEASGDLAGTAMENSSTSKPQEEVSNSQSATTVAASSSSKGTEEPKDAP